MSKTFDVVLKENDGAGRGFDLLRLGLALLILASHVSGIGGTRGFVTEAVQALSHLIGHGHLPAPDLGSTGVVVRNVNNTTPLSLGRPIVLSHVPMFFALSGFLVAGSAFRTKRVMPFLALRFFRIFPALCVEVVLSAVVIGAVFTSLPLLNYFLSNGFFTYFGNIIGIVQMELPGVTFHGSQVDNQVVNANLWTLPSEFHCYLILAFLIVTGLAFNRTIFTVMFAFATVAFLIANLFSDYSAPVGGFSPASVVVYYFFAGVLFFLWRDRIPYSIWLFLPCVVIYYFLTLSLPQAVFVSPLLLTYVTIFIGLTNLPTNKLLQSGDYSYGIYLYGFPISQVLVAIFPALRNNYYGLLLSAVLCTALFASLSWHLVEKRFLRLRKYFSTQSAKIAAELHPQALAQPDQASNKTGEADQAVKA